MTSVIRGVSLIVLALVCCLAAFGQTNPPGPPSAPAQSNAVIDVLKDPANLTYLTFLGANIADAKTDWHFTVGGKDYTFSPAQRMTIALGGSAVGLYLQSQFPRLKKPMAVVMGVATAYFAGKALAATYNQGAPPGSTGRATSPKAVFRVRVH